MMEKYAPLIGLSMVGLLVFTLIFIVGYLAIYGPDGPQESTAFKPLKYEYRAVSIATGRILYVTSVPEDTIVHRIELNGVPESEYRLERHLIRDAIKETSGG
jgi:hypothetical protein